MEPQYDVSPAVEEEQSVNQEFAPPVDESQQIPAEGNKDYNFRTVVEDRDKYRDQVSALEARVSKSEEMANMYNAMGYQQPQQPPAQQPQQQQSQGMTFDDAVDSESLNKMNAYYGQQAEQIAQQNRGYADRMEQMELHQRDPNWRDTVNKYLPSAVKKDPWIADKIRNSSTAWRDAYYYASKDDDCIRDKMAGQQNQDAQRMVNNATKPKTLGSTGAQANVGGYKDAFKMSQEEFEDAKRKIVAGTY